LKVRYLVVHHTAGPKTQTVQQIKDYHVKVKGYDDIAYNRLIDYKGKVYQGRLDDAYPAHALGLNDCSWGVSLIGDFSKEKPPEKQLHSTIQTLAILCKKHKLKANDIVGHRDVAIIRKNSKLATSCPGDALYGLLPEIRKQVSKYL